MASMDACDTLQDQYLRAEAEAMAWTSEMCSSPAPSLAGTPPGSPTPDSEAGAAGHDGEQLRDESLAALRRFLTEESMDEPMSDFLNTTQRGAITAGMRAGLYSWLHTLTRHFNYGNEVHGLAVSIMDSLLSRVRVQPKHLHVACVSAFLIAAKVYTDCGEPHPTLRELAHVARVSGFDSGTCFGEGDIKRMERLILEKLGWKVSRVTPHVLLHELFGVLDKDALLASRTHMLMKNRTRKLVAIPENHTLDFCEEPDFSILLQAASERLRICRLSYDFIAHIGPVAQCVSVLSVCAERLFGATCAERVVNDLLCVCASVCESVCVYEEVREGMWRVEMAMQETHERERREAGKGALNWCQ